MNKFNEQMIYDCNNIEIIEQINKRLKSLRVNCLLSQEELASKSGVSIATIKRIEGSKPYDVSISTVIKLLRTMSELQSIVNIIPEVPISPFLLDEQGKFKNKKTAKQLAK